LLEFPNYFAVAVEAVEQVKFASNAGAEGSCSVYPGYDISPGFDLALIPYLSTSECCQRCSKQSDCVGWTMYERKCHLKASSVLEKARVTGDTVSGLVNTGGKEATPVFSDNPPQVQSPKYKTGRKSTCSLHTDFEIAGEELKNVGYMYLSECCHECGNTPECTGWTYHNWECILKKGIQLTPKAGDVSGIIQANVQGDVAPPSQ